MSFSENLQTLRKTKGISQEQLAERLDVSRQAVSKWETDGGYPEMDKIIQLCDLFGVTMDELIKGRVEVDKADIRKKYDRHFNSFAKGIATGVFLIITGVAASSLGFDLILGDNWQPLGTKVMFIFIAMGVVLLTIFGIKNGSFEREHTVIPEIYAAEERERFDAKIFPYYIAAGIALIFLGVILSMIESFKAGNSIMLFLTALAVWLFIYAGIMHGKYDVREYNKRRDFEQGIKETDPPEVVRQKKRRKLWHRVSGVIMLSATAVYLTLGLIWGLWHPSWVIYPVCGIACIIAHKILSDEEK